jgi:hypothetical protein
MRPSEVLVEEWASLRTSNYSTPAFGSFTGVRANETLWRQILLRLYNRYPDMVWQHNKQAVFVAGMATNETTNQSAIAEILANDGSHNITLLQMDYPYNTSWQYLTTCNTPMGPTTIVLPERRCNSSKINHTPLGSVWVVQAEAAINSLPLASPGRIDGLTMRKLFEDVFADPSDFIFLPSWNEFVVGNHSMAEWAYPINNTYFTTDGLDHAKDNNHLLFIDGWGYSKARSLEPSVEDQSQMLTLLASCLRVLRLVTSGLVPKGSCSVSNEECCQLTAPQNVTRVWSLSALDSSDHLLSTDLAEVTKLNRTSHGLYSENCNPFGNPGPGADDFCTNRSMPYTPFVNASYANYAVRRGPFMAWNNATTTVPSTRPLYRCIALASQQHFVSLDPGCEGLGQQELLLVYISTALDGRTQRSLHRCRGNGLNAGIVAYYHALNGGCFASDVGTLLGYVV